MNGEPALAAVEVDVLADVRDRLRHAHEAKRQAEAKLADAKAAHARGQELANALQAEIDELDRQNDMLAQRAAERIAAGIRGADPAEEREESAPSVQERLQARAMSVRRHAYAERAVAQLHGEVEQAERSLAQAKYQIEKSIANLLLLEGERIAGEVLDYEARARDARHRLAGLSRLWIGRGTGDNRPSALHMGRLALQTLESLPLNDHAQQYPASHDPTTATLQKWQFIASLLLVDPEAEVD
jgi:hypothetical protein